MVEHSTENAGVVSSILTLGTTHATTPCESSSVVERFLAKEGVGGSNPLSRSTSTHPDAIDVSSAGAQSV